MEKITLHQALCELKVLDDRIEKSMNTVFAVCISHSDKKIKGVNKSEYLKQMKANFDKVSDLIERRKKIKSALTLANATIKVNIGNRNLTIAEAIEYNARGIYLDTELIDCICEQLQVAQNEAERNRKSLPDKAENFVSVVYGSSDKKDMASSEMTEQINKYIEQNAPEIYTSVDHFKCGVQEWINKKQEEIDNFKIEYDTAINIANATNYIEI